MFWNEAAEKFYHIPAQSIIGKKIQHFFRPEDLMVLQILGTKHAVNSLYYRPRPDAHVIINATPVLDNKGNLVGAISIEQDVSQLVKLNEELSETSLQLDELKTEVNREKEEPFFQIKGHSQAIRNCIELAK